MKAVRVLFRVAILLGCAAAASANSISDPTIIIKDPVCEPSKCTPVGTHFTFDTPATGRGVDLFSNASGKAWTSLRLVESGVAANLITCLSNVFASCSVGTLANGKTFIFLSGGAGITPGESFGITFGCSKGTCQPWPGGLDFRAAANLPSATTPEPATLTLWITGLTGIMTRRKLLKHLRA